MLTAFCDFLQERLQLLRHTDNNFLSLSKIVKWLKLGSAFRSTKQSDAFT